jgi:hypothetical protein
MAIKDPTLRAEILEFARLNLEREKSVGSLRVKLEEDQREAMERIVKRIGIERFREEVRRATRKLLKRIAKPQFPRPPEELPDPELEAERRFRGAFEQYVSLAEREYGPPIAGLLSDSNTERKQNRLWRLIGVILKQGFSEPVERRPAPKTGARYFWKIIKDRLADRAEAGRWEAEIIRKIVPPHNKAETVTATAQRLGTETNFGNAFRKALRDYICSDPEMLRKVEAALRKAGLGYLAKAITPDGLIAAGSFTLAAQLAALLPILSGASTLLIAGTSVALGTTGLTAFCGPPTHRPKREWKTKSPLKQRSSARRKKKGDRRKKKVARKRAG